MQVVSVRIRHILVSTKEMADELFSQLKAGTDFEELARAISGCESTRESGGEASHHNIRIIRAHGLILPTCMASTESHPFCKMEAALFYAG
jgi:hypothetical protein